MSRSKSFVAIFMLLSINALLWTRNYEEENIDSVPIHDFPFGNDVRQYHRQSNIITSSLTDVGGKLRNTSWNEINRRRIAQIKMVCRHHNNRTHSKKVGRFLFYKQIAYCIVPKTGCTLWKRIFFYLKQDFPNKVTSPLDIPRHFVHKNTTLINLSYKRLQIRKLKYIQKLFMFTRDPYSRVWSAYLDKLFLPDFWFGLGVPVIKSERKSATRHSLVCGDDVTFEEFTRYILSQPKQLFTKNHFAPVHAICDPCSVDFTYIGKLETFKDDVYYILKDTGLNFHLEGDLFNDTASDEIKTLSEDYLGMQKLGRKQMCKNVTLICERLWTVFQMNGYIRYEIPFPSDLLDISMNINDLKQTFISHAISEHKNGHSLHEFWKTQRRQSLVRAYKALPMELLQQFQAAYEKDFELFGYPESPKDIFS